MSLCASQRADEICIKQKAYGTFVTCWLDANYFKSKPFAVTPSLGCKGDVRFAINLDYSLQLCKLQQEEPLPW